MSILLKWLSRALIGFFLLSSVTAVVSYNLASRSLPVYDQNLVSEDIIDKIEIIRDSSNIPHVFASCSGHRATFFARAVFCTLTGINFSLVTNYSFSHEI